LSFRFFISRDLEIFPQHGTARDLLLERGHSDVACGCVVVEGHAPIGEEAQHRIAVLARASDEVVGGTLTDASAGAGRAGPGRIARRGGIEKGGLPELWLSSANGASRSAMRWRCCPMTVACSATNVRSRSTSARTAAGHWVATGSSGRLLNYAHRHMVSKAS
jgi:hypothetical protein